MKLKFVKTQTQETDKDKVIKLSFAGSLNNVAFTLSASGAEEDIKDFMENVKLKTFNEMIEMELKNNQSTMNDF